MVTGIAALVRSVLDARNWDQPPCGPALRRLSAAGRGSHRPRSCAALVFIAAVSPLGLAACGGGHGSSRPSYAISLAQGATAFAFQHPLPMGTAYTVAVTAQPSGENCVVSNGTGTIADQNVSNVAITCNSALSAPTTLGVYPADTEGSLDARVFLPVGMVGSQSVTINAILDTGSAGVDLDAFDVFPSSMVTANGFVFPSGQTSMTYNGITVTNVTAYRQYGSQTSNPTRDVGNLGFAQVTLGGGAQVTTAVVPILFVFQQVVNGASQTPNNFTNLIGVNASMAGLTVAGSPAASTLAPRTPTSTATCGVASPFRFLTYQDGAREGFELTQVTLHQCTISTAGSCTLENALVLGLNTAVSSAFKTTPLSSCGPVTIPNANSSSEQICSQVIPNVQIASGGSSFTGPAIFDSGEPQILFEVPTGGSFPSSVAQGSTVTVTTPAGFSYDLEAGAGYANINVDQNAGASSFSNLGIDYFTLHSLLVDYSQQIEGFD